MSRAKLPLAGAALAALVILGLVAWRGFPKANATQVAASIRPKALTTGGTSTLFHANASAVSAPKQPAEASVPETTPSPTHADVPVVSAQPQSTPLTLSTGNGKDTAVVMPPAKAIESPGVTPANAESLPTPGPLAEDLSTKMASEPSSTTEAFTPEVRPPAGETSETGALGSPSVTPGTVAAATTDDPDDADEDHASSSSKTHASSGSPLHHARSHHRAHATPTPAPSFFQRLFGIKPKPKPN